MPTLFRIEDLLAVPMTPSIRVRYGPGPDDAVAIDEALWEAMKERFVEFCISIPNAEGSSWRTLRSYTGQNGLMAKLLIALGDLAGVWTMHPRLDTPDLWQNPMYPMVLVQVKTVDLGVKPSRGDLEYALCQCCERPMGPADSIFHELQEDHEGWCMECAEAECELAGSCVLDKPKTVQPQKPVLNDDGTEFDAPDPEALARYLAQFDE